MRIVSLNQDRGIRPDSNKGAATHLREIRAAFAALDHQVIAVDEPRADRAARMLSKTHREAPIDLIYERYSLSGTAAMDWAKQHSIARVLEVNSPLLVEKAVWGERKLRADDQLQERKLFNSADLVVAVSGEVAEYINRRTDGQARVRVLPNGVDRSRFNLGIRDPELRAEFVDSSTRLLGFHGRLRPWHAFDRLVAACHGLLESSRKVHLLVVGEGDFATHLQQWLPAENYTVLPWQPPALIPRYVGICDILPLCYSPDAPCYFSPLKLIEAMACGVVPVAPRLGDLPKLIHDEQTGLLYEAGDDTAFEECLARLTDDDALRGSLRSAAASPKLHASWQDIAQEVLDLLAASPVAA